MQRLHFTRLNFPLDLGVLQYKGGCKLSLPRKLVEGTRFISVHDITGLEADNTYILRWNDESINIVRREQGAELRYALGDERKRVYVGLDKTKVGYGYRSWLNCPACKRRTAKIYNVNGVFACRECHNLIYSTSKYTGNKLKYLGLKVRELQIKLEVDTSKISSIGDINNFAFFKPKNMHWTTFERLQAELTQLQGERLKEWTRRGKIILDRYYIT